MKKSIITECIRISKEKLNTHPSNYKHYTFIVHKNKLIGYGTNLVENPPKYLGYHSNAMIHSEINAFKKNKGLIKGKKFEILNIRLSKEGNLKNSTPCNCCYNFMKEMGCVKFYFSTDCGIANID